MNDAACNHEATKFASHLIGYAQAQQLKTEPTETVGMLMDEMRRLVELDYARGVMLKHYERVVQRYIAFVDDVSNGKVGDAQEAAANFKAEMY